MQTSTQPGDWLHVSPRYRIRAARRLAARTKTQLSPALHVMAARNPDRVQRGTWLLACGCAALAGLGAAAGWW